MSGTACDSTEPNDTHDSFGASGEDVQIGDTTGDDAAITGAPADVTTETEIAADALFDGSHGEIAPDVVTPVDTIALDTTASDSAMSDSAVADTDSDDSGHLDATAGDSQAGDTIGGDTAAPDTGSPPPVDDGLNAGWIGGACASAADCDHPGFDMTPLCEADGFPNGYCTQACRQSTTTGAWICPDADVGPATPYTTTRCITADGAPRCAAECDTTKADSGCRPGYACVLRQRHGQPDRIFPVCLPEPAQVWPGEAPPADDIGASCTTAADCAHLACLELPGGYCTKRWCDVAGCPDGATCFGFAGGDSACLRDCGADDACRVAEGYACDADGTCWPSDDGPAWNPTVGAADCASAWGTGGSGLSPCDTTKDDYVVLRKSARNFALCKSGALVQNYRMGLGFAPVGDKEREGDGKTPEGVFYAAQLVPDSDYYRAFVVSYPDAADAARGLGAGLISPAEKTAIETAQAQCKLPPQTTELGSWIELHGEGGESDWTLGCAAIDNSAMDVVWAALGVRDTIVILP